MSALSSHIPFRRLVDLAEGRLSPGEREQVQHHMASCPRCTADVAWLEHTIGLMRSDDCQDAPSPVVARAVRLFRTRSAQPAPGILERVRAVLRFDSVQLTRAYGVRAEQPVARQLLFGAGEQDLDVRIAPAGDGWAVSGQVLGPCTVGQAMLEGTEGAAQATLNGLCEFTLPPVPPGRYTLLLRLPEVEVQVPELELGG